MWVMRLYWPSYGSYALSICEPQPRVVEYRVEFGVGGAYGVSCRASRSGQSTSRSRLKPLWPLACCLPLPHCRESCPSEP